MPTYISLIKWTDQGVQSFKESVSRAQAARDMAERMGGTLKDVYWTVGECDIVSIADFPDDATGTAFLLAIGSQGNIRTSTMRAFDEEQFAEVLGKLG
ncbi:GYD domain-containing protein [Phytoactinopolyspora mesophila]|uniref:GYD domain-containing protein n=1 Tax=Phytoactinopolyspora mesophila TaxID=2650750 RepID=A0A7K3M810_9ACTN|nr:GYD domain-containing protein [Phytoactinopolyspora mesophila]NDL59463.1 GYD domain-containing protein [Phytoactinopolyspora mesophila]